MTYIYTYSPDRYFFLKYKIKQTPKKPATIRTINNSDNFHVLTLHGFPVEFSMQSSNTPHDSHETAKEKKKKCQGSYFWGDDNTDKYQNINLHDTAKNTCA